MKHIPLRTCIQTRQKKPKNELIRFVINPETNRFTMDSTGKARSRGANLTMDLDVFDEAVKRKSFERALQCTIPDSEYAEVREQLSNLIEKNKFRKGRKQVSLRIEGKKVHLE